MATQQTGDSEIGSLNIDNGPTVDSRKSLTTSKTDEKSPRYLQAEAETSNTVPVKSHKEPPETTSHSRVDKFTVASNIVLQVLGLTTAVVFGIWAVKSYDISVSSYQQQQQPVSLDSSTFTPLLHQITIQNQVSLLIFCLQYSVCIPLPPYSVITYMLPVHSDMYRISLTLRLVAR